MSEETERLEELLGAFLTAEAVELDDLELGGRGRGRVLRVTLDAEGGIDVDRIADLSRGMSRLLDEADVVDGPYNLEVSSPGLERKLRKPAHYRKSVGRELVVKTTSAVGGEMVHRGILGEVDEDGFAVQLNEGTRRIGFGQVASARTVFRWEPSPKPGGRRR